MKKKIYLVIGLLAVALLTWFTINLASKRGRSDANTEMWDFAIKDTASIDKIIISEANGSNIEIIRSGNKWTDKNGGCIQQMPVFNILEAAVNVRLKGYITEGMMESNIQRLATSATEVKFFVNGEWHKTWYVGGSTPDHYGTYMLLDSRENGKSAKPVIMEMQGLNGILSPRFSADFRKWICTEIFAIDGRDIASVEVQHISRPERSFAIKATKKGFYVTSNGVPLPKLDTNMVTRYLNNYRKIHFETVNSELTAKQVDSVKKSTPFCVMTIKEKKGKTTILRMFRRAKDDTAASNASDMYGEEVPWDAGHFWCELPGGSVVKCQHFVFDPLIMGNIYLNYDITPQKYPGDR